MGLAPFVLLGVGGALCVGGGQSAVLGRLAIRRDGDRYRGSVWAWSGYLGGIVMVAVGASAFVLSILLAVS